MVADFPRTLSLLRQEKGISQRMAASSLNVSQALLSHYENGAREPGLDFLVRAADFYGVTTDYLLGRTMSRDAVSQINLPDVVASKNVNGSALATLRRKILTNSITLIYDILGKTSSKILIDVTSHYLALAVYKVFRYIYMSNPNTHDTMFSVPQTSFAELCDVEMKRLELALKLNAIAMNGSKTAENQIPEISYSMLCEEYPCLSQSMLALLHMSGECLIPKNENDSATI